jgi:endothelin-converting enzyme/putative endopeptidase
VRKLKISTLPFLITVAGGTVLASAQASTGAAKTNDQIKGLNTAFLDKSADPCTDFYQYACGKFSKLHPIPADHAAYSNGNLLFEANEKALHAILDRAALSSSNRTSNEQKIGDYFASCLDTKSINREGLRPFQTEFEMIDALADKSGLPAILAHDQLIGVNAFFAFGGQQDFQDARKQIAMLDQGGLGLPERDYYLRGETEDEKLRKQYVEHIANMMKLIGEREDKASADAVAIMDLETTLAKNSIDITTRRDPKNIYHLMPLVEAEQLAPAIDWSGFLKDTGAPPINEINVASPGFFKGLDALIASNSLDTIKAYLKWQLINSIPATTLPEALDRERFAFDGKILSGSREQRARWKRCVAATDDALGEALGQAYVADEFPPSSKAATQQIVRDVEAAMEKDIDTLDWMSAETRINAKKKLHAIANEIGYPDKWRDYSTLEVVRGEALGNSLRGKMFETRRQIDKIGKPVDRGEFAMSPPTVNAYYDSSMNVINFPAGILQPPLYGPKESDAVNYGHIGAVVGHEVTHGFDDQGRQFDGDGNLADWWTAEDGKRFDAQADCEVKEYGEFMVAGGAHVNGKLTLGENIADNGGIRLAFMALLADAKRKHLNLHQKMDGLSAEQQFFVAYAQTWCGEQRPEDVRMQVETDPHSPNPFRVNGVVRNMKEFGDAFHCKAGQPMEPTNACRVW